MSIQLTPQLLGRGRLGARRHHRAGQPRLRERAGRLRSRGRPAPGREYGFGVVRQLFAELGADHELTEGPAATARGVLADTGASEGTFPVLNGLHQLVVNLSDRDPLILAIDDLHWGDPASLRFLVYLARRLAACAS